MKLYHKINRLAYLKRVPKNVQKRIKWALSLNPGDLINDCSGFNVEIKKVEPDIVYTRTGWYIYNVIFENVYGGTCSLRSCGVEPQLSPEEIESRIRKFYDDWDKTPHANGGWDFKTDKDRIWTRISNGLSLCDERGRKLA